MLNMKRFFSKMFPRKLRALQGLSVLYVDVSCACGWSGGNNDLAYNSLGQPICPVCKTWERLSVSDLSYWDRSIV